ncbi:PD-(D/E)XK nuclease family protein [Nostoc sp. LEGE 06077]|uniref:PD-(D/E)XK nuclease family protein n=1 Tax=Nostoc sp. LEGE 06077 TaxID=915325 RepID=UPI001882A2A9|nr:PD-(D/E)XK nuclease family protein [Nostoc sp. LEGE 06077]MBE9205803.1 PD-(D/E)XK nuclease family protein [Nostoc sp. LEGE 06077]
MSLFTNLLNLHSGSKPLEDFFTEIVAYFFSIHQDLLIAWLQQNLIISDESYSRITITTQKEHQGLESHTADSRFDILIELSNGLNTDIIIIESKIGSTDGNNALKRYVEILSNLPNVNQRILLYITRNYDPQKEIKTFALEQKPIVNFHQLRWYQFYSFLAKHGYDTLAKEILTFMRSNKMADKNQFSSIDLLTMMNFNKTLNFMQATLSEEVEAEFKNAFARVTSGSPSITQWRHRSRYIIYTSLSDGWNLWCGLGYFYLNSNDFTSYPYIGICLEVSPIFRNRPKIIKAMQNIVNDKPEIWTPYGLTVTPDWSSIFYRKTLQDFLSYEDQSHHIKNFFLESIKELKTVKEQYFDFISKDVITEESIEEEMDIVGDRPTLI